MNRLCLQIMLLVFAVIITFSVHAGLGRHVFYLKKEDRIRAIKLVNIANPFLVIASSLPNVSVAISLNKILVPPYKWQQGFLFGIPILQCIICMISSIVAFTECSPPQSLWDNEVRGDCISTDAIVAILYLNSGKFENFTLHYSNYH